jgi:hypothetical protein
MDFLSGSLIHSTSPGRGRSEATPLPVAQLILSMHCDQPMVAPSRHVLAGLDEIRFGRGPSRIQRDPIARRLTLNIPDPRMSADHGQLVRRGMTWSIDDATSKNGCVLNGHPVRQAVLGDGDLLELGHTMFVFRVAPAPAGPLDVTADQLAAAGTGLVTFSAELAASLALLERIARTDLPVLLLGETGTGKELAARALHAHSGRPGPFVSASCGALPETFIELERSGARRGASPGPVTDRLGLLRSADRGTLFLDEIAELRASSRAAFLRVLQNQEVVPAGQTRAIEVDVRLCAASHRTLDDLVDSGGSRRDCYAPLFGATIELPPLRRRREDLGLLVRRLLARHPRGEHARFTVAAARLLHRHDWPYNMRQLERELTAAVALAEGRAIGVADLPLGRAQSPAPEIENFDSLRTRLVGLLDLHRGNIAAVARALDKDRMQIHRWMRRFALDLETFRR